MSKLFGNSQPNLSLDEKINFARHLSIVIRAGLPLLEGLKIIRRQTASKRLAPIIDQMIVDINNGQFLATSLERYRYTFKEFFINIVRVGEVSGTLASNLLYLSEELKKSKDLRSKVKSAMVYPVIVMAATLGIIGLLVFYVFPKVMPVFQSFNVQLPLTTRMLIATSSFLLAYGIYLAIGLIILFFLYRTVYRRVEAFKVVVNGLIFYVPVVSSLVVSVNSANFTRILAVLLKSGIKIVEALTITAQTFDNLVYRRALMKAAEEVRRGEPLAKYLSGNKKLFPPLASGLIEIGENTGNLEENLLYVSQYYTEEVDRSLQDLTAMLEPLLLLTMGVVVGFVAISIIVPIYQITQGVQH